MGGTATRDDGSRLRSGERLRQQELATYPSFIPVRTRGGVSSRTSFFIAVLLLYDYETYTYRMSEKEEVKVLQLKYTRR